MKVFPESGVLVPNESIDIEFTIIVNTELVPPLNFNKEELSDILIFRLENGTDYYVINYFTKKNNIINIIKFRSKLKAIFNILVLVIL